MPSLAGKGGSPKGSPIPNLRAQTGLLVAAVLPAGASGG